MTEKIIVPTADAVVTPVLEKLYEKRPRSFAHLNLRSGVYWHPVLGFRAQAAKMLQRLILLAAARRLKTATGQDLIDYVASEFESVPETGKTFAQGHITLGRGGPSPLPGGSIPKGTRFTRTSFTSLGIEFPTAEYETLADAFMPVNSTENVTVPIRATREGAHANTPLLTASNQTGITFPSIIENVAVIDFAAAGGSEGVDDPYVRHFAQAQAVGQYGPTSAASKLGALSGTGVRHLLVYDEVSTGTQKVLIADASWASSSSWANLVQQKMYDADLVGFGCRVEFGVLRNKAVSVSATIALRDANYLAETTEIDIAIQKAAQSYFDDRQDFNVWNTDSLKSIIARAHPKIFSCSSAVVKDMNDDSTVSEILSPNYATEQFHYYVASNAMKLSYVGPS